MHVSVKKIEVIQSIQNSESDVKLFLYKPTLIRVFLSSTEQATSISGALELNLELKENYSNISELKNRNTTLDSINSLQVSNSSNANHDERRKRLECSLNFELDWNQLGLPKEYGKNSREEYLKITPILKSVRATDLDIKDFKTEPKSFCFFHSYPLAVKCVGLRYMDQFGDYHQPVPLHYKYMRNYIDQSFPIDKLGWSSLTIDAHPQLTPPFSDNREVHPDLIWQEKINIAHAQLLAIQAVETDECKRTYSKTYFYGMVNDPDYAFRGSVNDAHEKPIEEGCKVNHDFVSAGFAEMDSGYYGAHEIAHCLDRLHPGFGNQERIDPDYPYAEGKISGKRLDSSKSSDVKVDDTQGMIDDHIGYSPDHWAHPARLLANTDYYDLMSYLTPAWVSPYTYEALDEALKTKHHSPVTKRSGAFDNICIIGTYNFLDSTGEILYVFDTKQNTDELDSESDGKNLINAQTQAIRGEKLQLQLLYERSSVIKSIVIKKKTIEAINRVGLHSESGVFQTVITKKHLKLTNESLTQSLMLVVNDQERYRYDLQVDRSGKAIAKNEIPFKVRCRLNDEAAKTYDMKLNLAGLGNQKVIVQVQFLSERISTSDLKWHVISINPALEKSIYLDSTQSVVSSDVWRKISKGDAGNKLELSKPFQKLIALEQIKYRVDQLLLIRVRIRPSLNLNGSNLGPLFDGWVVENPSNQGEFVYLCKDSDIKYMDDRLIEVFP